ncbi:MAG: NAD(P)H-binding protein [Rivularia sp. ALOHA_DT_140]|nr:NAD(P)H-binding protein [Rivularia sp. ALOHA_DT_140]
MRITVFGAAGNVGKRVVNEALARGHEVTAVVRNPARFNELNPSAKACVGDAGNVDDVVRLSTGQDLVISATRPPKGNESELVEITTSLLTGLEKSGVRLLLVGGAGSLTVPNSDGSLVVDDPNFVSPAWRDIALACVAQFNVCSSNTLVDWTYLCPPALLAPGERTGNFRLGNDELLIDAEGISKISMEDFSVALIDEAEFPRFKGNRFKGNRFTVAY